MMRDMGKEMGHVVLQEAQLSQRDRDASCH